MTPKARSYYHRGGETPLLGTTIGEHLREMVTAFPERDAVVSIPQNRRLCYREFAVQVDRLARAITVADLYAA